MRVIVDEYPTGCKECVFAGMEELWGYCVLTKWQIYDDENEEMLPYMEEHCPLVKLNELIDNPKEV